MQQGEDTTDSRAGFPRVARGLLSAVMVAAFVLCGLYGLGKGRSRRTVGNGPLNSADGFLSEVLHTYAPAEKIVATLAELPSDGPLAIIYPRTDEIYGPVLPQVIGTFTWPRPIDALPVDGPDVRETLGKLREYHYSAALIYNITPPLLPSNSRRIGLLTIVPIAP